MDEREHQSANILISKNMKIVMMMMMTIVMMMIVMMMMITIVMMVMRTKKGASESVLIFSIVGARHSFAREWRNPTTPTVHY